MQSVDQDGTIFVGKGEKPAVLTLALANRHGLVAGATGTGKTVTLQVIAEGLSRAGVSVFAADIKGDLSGISEVGPLLLSRLMDLNDIQEGVLNICFRVADEQGLAILDLKDLRAMLAYISDHATELTVQYGNVSKQTIGTIQRQLLVLENQGADKLFGE